VRATLFLVLLFCFTAPRAGGAQVVADSNSSNASEAQIEAILAEIRSKRQDVLSSGSDYERLKNQRTLEESEEALRQAKKSMEDYKKSLQPGTKAWDDNILIKDGRQFRSIPGRDKKKEAVDEDKYGVTVPDVGPGTSIDPRVHQHSWVGEPGAGPNGPLKPIEIPGVPGMNVGATQVPSSGEVLYGRPAGFRNSPGGPISDPRERKRPTAEPTPALPNAPIPPSTGSAQGRIEEPEEGGPIENTVRIGETGRQLPPLAPDGFTFDGPEGEMLKQFPELAVRELGVRDQGIALVKDAGRLLRSGDATGALRSADRLVQMAPSDPGVHSLRALILNRLGRFAEAESAAHRALALDDSRAATWRTLAWAQFKQGKSAAAMRSAQSALAINPKDASALALLGYAQERLGQRKQALQSIKKAAAISPRRYGPVAARAATGAPVAPASSAPRPKPKKTRDIPLWVGGLVAGGMLFGAAWFVFKIK